MCEYVHGKHLHISTCTLQLSMRMPQFSMCTLQLSMGTLPIEHVHTSSWARAQIQLSICTLHIYTSACAQFGWACACLSWACAHYSWACAHTQLSIHTLLGEHVRVSHLHINIYTPQLSMCALLYMLSKKMQKFSVIVLWTLWVYVTSR